MKKKHKGLKIFGIIIIVLVLLIVAALSVFAYGNLNYDNNNLKKVWKAGFTEKQATLSDGTLLNYAEGPDNGPAVLLIHGQSVEWEDYSTVLPELSKSWHIYDAAADKVASTIEHCTRLNIDSGHDIHQEHPDFFIGAFTTLRKSLGI